MKVLPSGVYYGKKHPFEDCPCDDRVWSRSGSTLFSLAVGPHNGLLLLRAMSKARGPSGPCVRAAPSMFVDTKIDTIFVGGGADPSAVV